jgi:hypothetical protein
MIAWLSTITLLGFTQPSYAQTTCENLPISGGAVTASGTQSPNTPSNTVDNNLGTRWSNEGLPSFITYDLGQSRLVCSLDIAFYQGNSRTVDFTISVASATSPNTFTTVLSDESSGTTTSLESYDVTPDVNARFVRITVTDNTANDWASITEVDIFASSGTPPPTTCGNLPISGGAVTASGTQSPNTPSNTVDNNLGTRWSNEGLPSFITYDLGQSRLVCSADIAFYQGNSRTMTFTISVSNDGTPNSFTPVLTDARSSGTTTALESYDFTDVNARFVRITVTANSANNYASITEVDIFASGGSQPPPPGSDVDQFGIRKIYPTQGNENDQWFMNMNNPSSDPRTSPPGLTRNPGDCTTTDPCWGVSSTQVRYGVFTTSGYQPNIIELDHGVLAQRGYMQSPNDWKNVEMTGYVRLVDDNTDSENFAWYARGGRHTGSGSPEGCEGSSIKGDLFYNGRARFAKEQWHVSYVFRPTTTVTTDIEDRWVGFKTIMWNEVQSGETILRMELWLDNNSDGQEDGPWTRVYQTLDNGGWGDEGGECDGEPDQIITWGGPIATFRWDGATNVHIKNLSVREIQPPT